MPPMTPEQLASYNASLWKIAEMFDKEYVNVELENLMLSSDWKTIYCQLSASERKLIQGYLIHLEDDSQGYLKTRIPCLEAVRQKLEKLIQLEKNARWVVHDRRTNLYFARVIESPFWDKKSKAFLLSQQQAERLTRQFCRQTTWYRFEAMKIDATRRLGKSKF